MSLKFKKQDHTKSEFQPLGIHRQQGINRVNTLHILQPLDVILSEVFNLYIEKRKKKEKLWSAGNSLTEHWKSQ